MADTLDPTMQFVVNSGSIRFRMDTDEWKSAYYTDINEFISALVTAAPIDGVMTYNDSGAIYDKTVEQPGDAEGHINMPSPILKINPRVGEWQNAEVVLNPSTSNGLWFEFAPEIVADVTWFTMVIHMGESKIHYHICSRPNRLIYWCLIRTPYGELSVCLGSSLNIAEYQHPSDVPIDSPTIIRNNLCKFTPITFSIINVVNSITNTSGHAGIVVTHSSSNLSPIADSSPYGFHVDEHITIGNGGSAYVTSGAEVRIDGQFYKPLLVTSDVEYYCAVSHGRYTDIKSTGQGTYLVSAYHPASICVGLTTLFEEWGTTIDPHGIDGEYPHAGPECVQVGSNWFIRSGGMFLQIPEPVTTSQGNDDNNED